MTTLPTIMTGVFRPWDQNTFKALLSELVRFEIAHLKKRVLATGQGSLAAAGIRAETRRRNTNEPGVPPVTEGAIGALGWPHTRCILPLERLRSASSTSMRPKGRPSCERGSRVL